MKMISIRLLLACSATLGYAIPACGDAALMMIAPGDTAGSGTYPYVEEVLEQDVRPLLTSPSPGYVEIRSDLGIPQQDTVAPHYVVTDSTRCEPLVSYFKAHKTDLYGDTAQLREYGWQHAVFEWGPYRMLYVAGNDPPGIFLGYRAVLYIFDSAGVYLGSVIV